MNSRAAALNIITKLKTNKCTILQFFAVHSAILHAIKCSICVTEVTIKKQQL